MVHFQLVKHILCYVQGTISIGLHKLASNTLDSYMPFLMLIRLAAPSPIAPYQILHLYWWHLHLLECQKAIHCSLFKCWSWVSLYDVDFLTHPRFIVTMSMLYIYHSTPSMWGRSTLLLIFTMYVSKLPLEPLKQDFSLLNFSFQHLHQVPC